MKQYCLIVLVTFILGCSTQTQEASSDQNTTDTLSSVQPLQIDTIPQTRIEVNLKPVVIPEDNVPQTDSSQILIVPVYNFVPTSEAYVFLNFNESYSYDSITMIKSHLDSVVFDDMETRRQRLPMDKAKVFLDLSLLDSISIFNYSHEFKSMAPLKRVEYLDANITGGFVAVFDTPGLKEWELYGISGTSDFIDGFKSEHFEDKTLNQAIKVKVNPRNLRTYDVTHVSLHSYGKTLSAYSCGDYIDNHKSYLVETNGDLQKILFELDEYYTIWDITPVPIQINQYPILLLRLAKPETDMVWYSPAVFDGNKYQIVNERVVLSDFLDEQENDSINTDESISKISLVDNVVYHSFSDPTKKDKFSISIIGNSIVEGKIIFEIVDSKGATILNEEYPSKYLIGYGLIGDSITNEQKEEYIVKRLNDFFDEKNFSKTAIPMDEEFDMDYSNEEIWNDIKSDSTAVGFYYLIGEESGCMIAYSKRAKRTVKYFCCC